MLSIPLVLRSWIHFCLRVWLYFAISHWKFTLIRCLFIKTWALYKIWQDAANFKKNNLTAASILQGIGIYLVVEIVSIPSFEADKLWLLETILIAWSVVDRPRAELHSINWLNTSSISMTVQKWWMVVICCNVKQKLRFFGLFLSQVKYVSWFQTSVY